MKQAPRECSTKGCKNTMSPEWARKMCSHCLAGASRRRQKSRNKTLEARKQGLRLCSRPYCSTRLPQDSRTSYCAKCLWRSAESYRRVKEAKRAAGCCMNCSQRSVGSQPYCLRHSLKSRRDGVRMGARKRNLKVNLTEEEMNALFVAPCYYCGEQADPVNGIDRKDSSLGYSSDNVCTACWTCNKAKGTMSVREYLEACQRSRGRWMSSLLSLGHNYQALLECARAHTAAACEKFANSAPVPERVCVRQLQRVQDVN